MNPAGSQKELSQLSDGVLVTIIVPSYNMGRFINETIESILSQTYRPVELIVVDGGSSDNTLKILRSYSNESDLRWISEDDSGIVEAVNKGFSMASGGVWGIQSADDAYADRHAIENAVGVLKSNPGVGLVYGQVRKIDGEGDRLSQTDLAEFSIHNLLCKRTRIPQESTFFRRELFERVGGWREEVSYAADTDFFMRCAFVSEARRLDQVVGVRRMHPNQRDSQSKRIVDAYCRMVDTSIEIQNSSISIRRAADAGKQITKFRYNSRGSELLRTYYLYRAKLVFPASVSLSNVQWQYLIPGLMSARKVLSRLKRRFRVRADLQKS